MEADTQMKVSRSVRYSSDVSLPRRVQLQQGFRGIETQDALLIFGVYGHLTALRNRAAADASGLSTPSSSPSAY